MLEVLSFYNRKKGLTSFTKSNPTNFCGEKKVKLNFQGCNFFFLRISEKNFLKSQILSSLSFSSPNLEFSNERKPDVEAESFFTCFPEKSSASESSPLALCYECINLKKKNSWSGGKLLFELLSKCHWIQPAESCRMCNSFPAFWMAGFFVAFDWSNDVTQFLLCSNFNYI